MHCIIRLRLSATEAVKIVCKQKKKELRKKLADHKKSMQITGDGLFFPGPADTILIKLLHENTITGFIPNLILTIQKTDPPEKGRQSEGDPQIYEFAPATGSLIK